MKHIKILSIFVVTFTILFIIITSICIKLNSNNLNTQNLSGDTNTYLDNSNNNEQGIDLYATYDQNDLIINQITDIYDEIEITIPQIEGLKNKDIESKINNQMRTRIFEKLNSIENLSSCNFYVIGNFANIISIGCNFSWNEYLSYDSIYLNYELVNGEKLKFEDIFKKNTDILSIVRNGFYATFSKNSYYEMMNPSVEVVDENTVYRQVKKFINEEDKVFSISPNRLILKADDYVYINLIDIADEVVIYNKYQTKDSIFLRDDIGFKNIFTCVNIDFNNMFEYIEYGYIEDNLWYDLTGGQNIIEDISGEFGDKYNQLKMEEKEKIDNEVLKYREIARNNPDKFYIFLNKQNVYPYMDSEYIDDTWVYKYSYITSVSNNTEIFEMPISVYNEIYKDKIIDAYRDTYFTMRGGLLIEVESGENVQVNKNNEEYVINLNTKERIEKLSDIFYEDSGYMDVIKNTIKERLRMDNISINNLDEMLANATYTIISYCVRVVLNDIEYSMDIYYQDFADEMIKLWVE